MEDPIFTCVTKDMAYWLPPKNNILTYFFQMETTIKQSQTSRDRCLENVRRIHADYTPLKEEIDKMRDSLGLDKLPGLPDEDKLKKE